MLHLPFCLVRLHPLIAVQPATHTVHLSLADPRRFVFVGDVYTLQALRVVMVMGVLEGGFLVYNSLQDRFDRKDARPDKTTGLT